MRRILLAALAVASLTAPAGMAAAQVSAVVRPDTVTHVDDWRPCRSWDGRRRLCRDADWDRNRWREHDWYGPASCASGHERFIDRHGRWRFCHR